MKMLIWIICLLGALSPASAMTVDQVIDLSREGASAKTIIRQIHAKRVVFKLEPEDEDKLRTAGVDIVVVEWMRTSQFVYGDALEITHDAASLARNRTRIVAVRAAESDLKDLRGRKAVGDGLVQAGGIPAAIGVVVLIIQGGLSDEHPQNYLPMTITAAVGGAVIATGFMVQPSERDLADAERRFEDAKRSQRFSRPRAYFLSAPAVRF